MNGFPTFYIKAMIKNPIFFIYLSFVLFFVYFIKDSLHITIFRFVTLFFHGYICSNLFLLISAAWVISKQYETFVFLERDVLKKQWKLLFSAFIISSVVALLPMAAMVTFKNPLTDGSFLWKGLVHFFILWTISNMLAATIGTTIGIFVRHRASILLSLLLYGFFLWKSMNMSFTYQAKLLNIFDDHMQAMTNTMSGTIFNLNYFLDKLFLILLMLFLLLITYSVYRKEKTAYILLAVLALLAMEGVAISGEKNVQKIQKYPAAEFAHVPYAVQTYKMDLALTNRLENTAELEMSFSAAGDNIKLLLDDCFTIDSVKVNDSLVKFTHKNNVLTISATYRPNETKKVVVSYGGDVQIEDELGVPIYYVTSDAVNLPGWLFAWYPTVPEPKPSYYDVRLDASTKIYSNLGIFTGETEREGETSSLSLFAGQYQTLKENGLTYILPINYNLENFQSRLDLLIQEKTKEKQRTLTTSDIQFLQDRAYKTVIVGSWPYNAKDGDIQLVGNTLFFNYME
nr:hypothetical protein [Bacillaceae bacterium]